LAIFVLVLGVLVQPLVHPFYVLGGVVAVEDGVGAEDVVPDLGGLDDGPHLLYLVVFLLAVGELVLEEGVHRPRVTISSVDRGPEGALLHLVTPHLLLELLKLLAHLAPLVVAHSGCVLLIFLPDAELPVQHPLIFILSILIGVDWLAGVYFMGYVLCCFS
jgi:hypothetical protein